MCSSGIKQQNHVLRKDYANSVPNLRQKAVIGTNNSKVTDPSQVGCPSYISMFPEGIF